MERPFEVVFEKWCKFLIIYYIPIVGGRNKKPSDLILWIKEVIEFSIRTDS